MEELKEEIINLDQLTINDPNICNKLNDYFEKIKDYNEYIINDYIDELYNFISTNVKKKFLSENNVPVKYNNIILNVYKGGIISLNNINNITYIAKLYDLLEIEYKTGTNVSIDDEYKYMYAIALSPKTDCNIYINKIDNLNITEDLKPIFDRRIDNIEDLNKFLLHANYEYCQYKKDGKPTRDLEDEINKRIKTKIIDEIIMKENIDYLLSIPFIRIDYYTFLVLVRKGIYIEKIENIIIENDLKETIIKKNFLMSLSPKNILEKSDLILGIIEILGEDYDINKYHYHFESFNDKMVILNPIKSAFIYYGYPDYNRDYIDYNLDYNHNYIEWLFDKFKDKIDLNYKPSIKVKKNGNIITEIYENGKLFATVKDKKIDLVLDKIEEDNEDCEDIVLYPIIVYILFSDIDNNNYTEKILEILERSANKDIDFEFQLNNITYEYDFFKRMKQNSLYKNNSYNMFKLIHIFINEYELIKKLESFVINFNINNFKGKYLEYKMITTGGNKQYIHPTYDIIENNEFVNNPNYNKYYTLHVYVNKYILYSSDRYYYSGTKISPFY